MSTKTGVPVSGVLGNLSKALSYYISQSHSPEKNVHKSLKCQWAPWGTHITLPTLKVHSLHAEPDDVYRI